MTAGGRLGLSAPSQKSNVMPERKTAAMLMETLVRHLIMKPRNEIPNMSYNGVDT